MLYGSLTVFITAVYVGLVAGVGTLVGNRRNALLSALAAAVVAVAFQPLRYRAGRVANRVVYGRRATPYEVLSDFSRRVGRAYSSEDVLPQMAHIVAAGTGAEQVVIWLRVGDELQAAASSSGQSADAAVLYTDGDAMPALPGADVSVPVVHQGGLLGAISIRMGRQARRARRRARRQVRSPAAARRSPDGCPSPPPSPATSSRPGYVAGGRGGSGGRREPLPPAHRLTC